MVVLGEVLERLARRSCSSLKVLVSILCKYQ